MTGRDRIVLIAVAVIAVLGAAWLLAVSPERKQANELAAQVAAAQSKLASAESKEADAHTAQAQYASAYASVVSLGKAVPASQEVPALIYQLTRASNQKNVDFSSITSGSGASSSASGASGAPAAGAPSGFTQLPFTFVFEGGFFDLERLFHRLDGFAALDRSGTLQVDGRLLTIQSVRLAPQQGGEAGATSTGLTGTITATAYVLPAGEALTAGASPTSPAGASTAASTTTATSSATAPAIARVSP